MNKLLLGDKQTQALQEALELAINFLVGVDEYKADYNKFSKLQNQIEAQLAKQKQTETPARVSKREALADEVRERKARKWTEHY